MRPDTEPSDFGMAPMNVHRRVVEANISLADTMRRNGIIDGGLAVVFATASVGLALFARENPALLSALCISGSSWFVSTAFAAYNLIGSTRIDAVARTAIDVRVMVETEKDN